jgi:regulator of sigma E protease
MMSFIVSTAEYTLPFLLIISLIVTIHELGHFLVGKAFGAAIDCFSIGFGPTLVSWTDGSGVVWRIAALPLGGYVKFAGDENIASVPDQSDLETLRQHIVARDGPGAERRYLAFKPLWQRALVILAGPAANFILAIVLFSGFFAAFGQPMSSNRVDAVVPASAAARAGFLPGDVVVAADSKIIHNFEDVKFYVQYRAGVPIDFTVLRAGRPVHLSATPEGSQVASPFGGVQTVGLLGVAARAGEPASVGPIEAVSLGVGKTWDVTATTAFFMGRIVTGHVGADQVHSLAGIFKASGSLTAQAVDQARAAKVSWVITVGYVLVQMAALMSVSVGLLNLMPIPVLDGGHLLSYAYEAIVRRPPAAVVQMVGYRAGLALLVGLMLFATWNDLGRQGVFHFFGSLFS